MNRNEIAKVLRDEIERTREQLARLRRVLVTRREERTSGLDQCEECERLRKVLSETTARAETAEQLREEARQRLAEHQAAIGHG